MPPPHATFRPFRTKTTYPIIGIDVGLDKAVGGPPAGVTATGRTAPTDPEERSDVVGHDFSFIR
jgi:hypothetical protein